PGAGAAAPRRRMRARRPLACIFVVATTLVAAPSAGAQDDTIPLGVTVGGVPVGGLSVEAARARVDLAIARPLRRRLVVRAGRRRRRGGTRARRPAGVDGAAAPGRPDGEGAAVHDAAPAARPHRPRPHGLPPRAQGPAVHPPAAAQGLHGGGGPARLPDADRP